MSTSKNNSGGAWNYILLTNPGELIEENERI